MIRQNQKVYLISLAAALAIGSLMTGCTHPTNDEPMASTATHLSAPAEVPPVAQALQSQEAQGRAADAAKNAAAMKAARAK